MPQIPRNLRLAYQRYFSDHAVMRWISKKQAIIMKEPQTRAVLCWVLHYAVFVNTLLILCLFRINPIKFVRLSAYAFYVSGSFVFLCAVVEYLERRKVRTESLDHVNPPFDSRTLGDTFTTGLEDHLCRGLAPLRSLSGAYSSNPAHTAVSILS